MGLLEGRLADDASRGTADGVCGVSGRVAFDEDGGRRAPPAGAHARGWRGGDQNDGPGGIGSGHKGAGRVGHEEVRRAKAGGGGAQPEEPAIAGAGHDGHGRIAPSLLSGGRFGDAADGGGGADDICALRTAAIGEGRLAGRVARGCGGQPVAGSRGDEKRHRSVWNRDGLPRVEATGWNRARAGPRGGRGILWGIGGPDPKRRGPGWFRPS